MLPPATTTMRPVRILFFETQLYTSDSVEDEAGDGANFGEGAGGGFGRAEAGSQSDDESASRRTFETFCRCLSTASATSPEYRLMSLGTEESCESIILVNVI